MWTTLFQWAKTQVSRKALDRLNDSIGTYGRHFGNLKGKIMFQAWAISNPNLILSGKQLDEMVRFTCFDNCISPDGRKSEEVPLCIQKALLPFNKLGYLLRRHGIRFSNKDRVHTAAVTSISLYDSKTCRWNQKIYEDLWCLKTVVLAVFMEYDRRILYVTQKLGVRYWILGCSLENRYGGMFYASSQNDCPVVRSSPGQLMVERWSDTAKCWRDAKVWKLYATDWNVWMWLGCHVWVHVISQDEGSKQ